MWGQRSYIHAPTDWERSVSIKLEIMANSTLKVRKAIQAFTRAREDSGLELTFGSGNLDDVETWVRDGPHHSVVLKNIVGRIANGLSFLSKSFGNEDLGKYTKKLEIF